MRHRWPEGIVFTHKVLVPEDRDCPCCGRLMHICDHRRHPFYTLDGPVQLLCKLVHCPDKNCADHTRTHSPLAETALVLPGWLIAWDVFCWIGHRRCARHWSVPQIRAELADTYRIPLSSDAIEVYIDRYQTMLAARQQDPDRLAALYQHIPELILSIDGIQPEKGHETLYVVRELNAQRVWFAEPLLSSTAAEVRRLLTQAHGWAERLGKKVRLWVSDKQDAFVTGIAAEFPEVPHRYCANHFLRDLAKPVLEQDSHAKVKMRKQVRGLRAIERQVLEDRRAADASAAVVVTSAEASANVTSADLTSADLTSADLTSADLTSADAGAGAEVRRPADEAGAVVLDYCAAVRGILNDDQGGPLHPPGLRMAAALGEVGASLHRNLETKKGGARRSNCAG